ncbi:solute carrier family 52, riboflavin transporter, member 3-A-like isoform X2 [Dermacentor albipictus]|uniref:solute carrier family 52, riboflavin transporter, member 3-A-like isoform X2 n=1 Tax=Dermacentor albipictus TaxID=60249 RepID=UPI0038FD1505
MAELWFFTKERRPLVDLLCMLYGLSSWLAITGLWMELPLLVHALPEGWALSASLSLAIQLGNVGPLLYGVSRFVWPRIWTGPRGLSVANHAQLCIGLAACVALVCAWKVTASILGRETSLVLLIAAFALSIVDCTSSVVYLPFVGRFREVYMTSYLVGEGLGGVVPSLVALAQGLDEPECVNETRSSVNKVAVNSSEVEDRVVAVLRVGATNFDPEVFFGVLLLLVVLSYAAFVLLDNCKSFQTEWQEDFVRDVTRRRQLYPAAPEAVPLDAVPVAEEKKEVLCKRYAEAPLTQDDGEVSFKRSNSKQGYYITLLAIQTWASLLTFGFLPAIQSYSCLPYGPRALHLSVSLCGVAYPVACALAMFVALRRTRHLCAQTLLGTLGAAYITLTAATSPNSPLVDTDAGAFLVVCCWVCTFLVLSYAKTMVTLILTSHGENALFWVGACTQIGALAGSLIPYILVNMDIFAERDHCALAN